MISKKYMFPPTNCDLCGAKGVSTYSNYMDQSNGRLNRKFMILACVDEYECQKRRDKREETSKTNPKETSI